MRLSSREKIIKESLTLFSENGYEAVSVSQIANAVGIKAPSLYKHFKSKQAIFDAILEMMAIQYQEKASVFQMDGSDPKVDASMFYQISDEELIAIGRELFRYYLHDDFACKFRKMLMMEQYHNSALSQLYIQQFIEAPIAYQSALFDQMIHLGVMDARDSKMLAIKFFSPLYLMISVCDSNPEKEEEALKIIEEHIRDFNRLYRNQIETR